MVPDLPNYEGEELSHQDGKDKVMNEEACLEQFYKFLRSG